METVEEYERCMEAINQLIWDWERMRPNEEMVVIVLPKKDQTVRKQRLEELCRNLLRKS